MITTIESFLFSTFQIFNTLLNQNQLVRCKFKRFQRIFKKLTSLWIGDFSATVSIQISKAGKLGLMKLDLKRV